MTPDVESKPPCKSAKEQLVQIGERAEPAYWKSVDELRNGPRFSGEFLGGSLPSQRITQPAPPAVTFWR